MEVDPSQLYGVISGDIVGSTKLDRVQREQLFFRMKEGSDKLQR
jgi:hypothetical protein